jgi:hypothetical protein
MLVIKPSSTKEFSAALSLMKQNMESLLVSCGLSWDEQWNQSNYISKDNYSIFSNGDWIGFLSLDLMEDCLFVHTMQLTKAAQGSTFGYRVYEWIRAKADSAGCRQIGCKAFSASSVVSTYKKIGFKIVETQGSFCEMRLNLAQ